jgi:hypothetical protein
VFIAALTGSGLFAKLDKPKDEGWWPFKTCKEPKGGSRCACTSDWYKLYFDPMQLILWAPCFFENFALGWDQSADGGLGDIVPKPGVKIATENGMTGGQPKGTPGAQGDPDGRGLDYAGCMNSLTGGGACSMYMPMQESFIRTHGYSMAQFRSVTYDYRLGPKQWRAPVGPESQLYETGLYDTMKGIFEEAKKTLGQKALIVSLSEGGTVTKAFLDAMTQEWKDEYIDGWMSYSSVFAGATQMAWNQMSGLPFYTSMVKGATKGVVCGMWPSVLGACPYTGTATFTDGDFQKALQNFPGQAVTSPTRTGTNSNVEEGADNNVLFYTPSRKYTYVEYTEALRANGLPNVAGVFDSLDPPSGSIRPNFEDPGVRTWCIYSNMSTPIGYVYDFDFDGTYNPRQPVSFVNGDGDGTVHMASLNICDRWESTQTHGGKPIDGGKPLTMTASNSVSNKITTVHRFQGYSHASIMTDPTPTKEILNGAITDLHEANLVRVNLK